jgi:hypothetical protein
MGFLTCPFDVPVIVLGSLDTSLIMPLQFSRLVVDQTVIADIPFPNLMTTRSIDIVEFGDSTSVKHPYRQPSILALNRKIVNDSTINAANDRPGQL